MSVGFSLLSSMEIARASKLGCPPEEELKIESSALPGGLCHRTDVDVELGGASSRRCEEAQIVEVKTVTELCLL